MKGSEIAENLRQHREQWRRNLYHSAGKYCVIGLKLHEAGIPVERWTPGKQDMSISGLLRYVNSAGHYFTIEEEQLLQSLQSMNDNARTVDDLIAKLDDWNYKDVEFPLEKLASALRGRTLFLPMSFDSGALDA